MLRCVAVFGATIIAVQIGYAGAQAVPAPEPGPQGHHRLLTQGLVTKPTRHASLPRVGRKRVPTPDVQTPPDTLPGPPPELSDQQERVRELAEKNGDREFLMVDKALGKIILFANDNPIYSDSALTGASTADQLPPTALAEKFSKLNDLDTKVTPAGRFTVRRGRDKIYGPLLDINEIRGKDWGIAIHQVYLGIPSENRAARLKSPKDEDKRITYGCINVTPETIRFLLKELPRKQATPLYILPRDEAKTAAYFTPHNS